MNHSLNALIPFLADCEVVGSTDQSILSVSSDSRVVGPGTLFVAQRGTVVDGHTFIDGAIAQGVTAIMCETLPEQVVPSVTYIVVKDSRSAAAIAAAWLYDFPAQKLRVIGVTGTNGKTTVATLLYEMLNILGRKSGLVSTVEYRIGEKVFPSTHTTPDSISLQKLFSDMVQEGCTDVVMEVSSHAIDQARVAGISFAAGIFTNLTQDHLDYHKTMERYAATKQQFFTTLPKSSVAVTNADDEYGMSMVSQTSARIATYGTSDGATYEAVKVATSLTGTTFVVEGMEVQSPLIGGFNVSNMLACYSTLRELGYAKEVLIPIIPKLAAPSGRLELVRTKDRLGIVDYAHTPDGLEQLLKTVAQTRPKDSRIILVFGCGGDRDRTKRPMMALIAARYADWSIITSDNPRSEDPMAICNEVALGMPEHEGYEIVVDRAQAIMTAVQKSTPHDVVVVAGKGHEEYQIIGTQKNHFSDKEVLLRALSGTVS